MRPQSFRATIVAIAAAALLLLPATAWGDEPDDSFDTATGPLTAGMSYKPTLTTINDADFFFFYIPDTTAVSVTTANLAKKKGGAGRAITSSLLRGRTKRLPLPLADTQRTLKPGEKATVRITLVPGKYFVPVGHAPSKADPQPNVPFRLRIGPLGSTTDSFELFARRCNDAERRVSRIKSSKKNVAGRLAKAKRQGDRGKARKLKGKLRSKRRKIDEAQRLKRIVCSVPQ